MLSLDLLLWWYKHAFVGSAVMVVTTSFMCTFFTLVLKKHDM